MLDTAVANSSFNVPAMRDTGTNQVLTSSGSSQQSAVTRSHCIRVVCTQDVWLKIGPNPTADKTTSIFLPSGTVDCYTCAPTDKVAYLQDSAAGTLNICPFAEV